MKEKGNGLPPPLTLALPPPPPPPPPQPAVVEVAGIRMGRNSPAVVEVAAMAGGGLPSWLIALSQLEHLLLGNNNFTDSIPPTIFNISSQQIIDFSLNGISGNLRVDVCNHLPKLEELQLQHNELNGLIPSGEIPEEIGNLRLEELVLQYNYSTGPIPAAIFNISTLWKRLDLVGNHLSGNLPSDIGHSLPNLGGLFLAENNLTGVVPHSISNASNLTILELSFNTFTGSIPHSLGDIRSFEILNLAENNFVSESSSSSELSFLTSLTNCRNLRHLGLGGNPLNGKLPISTGNFSTSLQDFEVSNGGIKGYILTGIGNLSSLISLHLNDNELTGLIPTMIKELGKLQRFYLYNNRIQGTIPLDLCHLLNLGELVLSGNRLFGPVPACLGNWKSTPRLASLNVATQIDLSMNQFTGNIPSTIGGLQDLTSLSLENNRLQGPIPDVFQSMVGLEFLDLSHNNLSGVIPRSLETLWQLKYFNVSFNRLSGEIPTGGPFANFTNQSFMSNEALCDASQFQVLPCDTSSLHRSRTKRVLLVMHIMLPIVSILLVLTVAFVCLRCRKKNKTPIQTGSILAIARERIAYHELLQATDGFRDSNLLGKGSFGSVYRGILINGTILAVKVFNLQLEGALKSFDTECEILHNIRRRNLTKVISSCSNLDFKALILQYMPNGSLEKWLYSHNYCLDISQRLDVTIDAACAIDYLHNGYSTSIVHCDLKPRNVLLDEDMVAHVSDFGIGKFLGDGKSTALTKTIATFGYITPEYGMEGLVSTSCDVYSYGIMLMEIFTRRKPTNDLFSGDLSLKGWVKESLPNAVIQVIDSNLLRPEEEDFATNMECVSSIMELALNCSAESPRLRINIGDVLVALKKVRLQFRANRVRSSHKL
ncbi:probable LRR receptor-like serine/threonine-protein kinase At3g47570 [Cornus florida]|uniref:probable LRR receptor-like serine/threonine-protein kinase At3g47570 n=1 Tax=Cornus florida TaxID=4283 RepID=UPI00289FBB7F|nr:probable LRR receptor-like serine/threonine-protein kinase At3g47570 [Cornus florida]